ncbi:MAG: TetR/AcrR family transcriptional regulator [Polyangiales bacterium]
MSVTTAARKKARTPPRPARGTPEETRARLVAAAADVFERDGYHGTDSNALARAAGYSPGTFYKHFVDKRALFLAVYEAWVGATWKSVESALVAEHPSPDVAAKRIVTALLVSHERWAGFRRSLKLLAATDDAVRAAFLDNRRRQLAGFERLRAGRPSSPNRAREEDALLMFTLERACDAIADGEADGLGVTRSGLIAQLVSLVRAHLGAPPG